MTEEKELARCRDFDFGIEDHGCPYLLGYFEYEGGSCQGLGYMPSIDFMVKILKAIGVDSLNKMEGKSCWVTHTQDKILLIEPLHKKDGKPFDVMKWVKEKQKETP